MSREKKDARKALAKRYRYLCKRFVSLSDKVSERQYVSANLHSRIANMRAGVHS